MWGRGGGGGVGFYDILVSVLYKQLAWFMRDDAGYAFFIG